MIEAVLLLVIVSLVALIGWMDYNHRSERRTMLNAILAKDTTEMVNLELAQKTKINMPVPQQDSGVDFATLTDDEAEDFIVKDLERMKENVEE